LGIATLRERLRAYVPRALEIESRRRAAVLLPLFGSEDDPQLLCFRRSWKVLEHRGEVCFPGGSAEPQDSGPVHTALRESFEELGLPSEAIEILGLLDDVETAVSNYVVTPVVGFMSGSPEVVADSLEVDTVIQVPISRLREPGVFSSQWSAEAGPRKLRYAYEFDQQRIWGATGRMLHALLAAWQGEAAP